MEMKKIITNAYVVLYLWGHSSMRSAYSLSYFLQNPTRQVYYYLYSADEKSMI